eukprot:scaffold28222_cov89-Phaeocystis_antarctica.AAC.7
MDDKHGWGAGASNSSSSVRQKRGAGCAVPRTDPWLGAATVVPHGDLIGDAKDVAEIGVARGRRFEQHFRVHQQLDGPVLVAGVVHTGDNELMRVRAHARVHALISTRHQAHPRSEITVEPTVAPSPVRVLTCVQTKVRHVHVLGVGCAPGVLCSHPSDKCAQAQRSRASGRSLPMRGLNAQTFRPKRVSRSRGVRRCTATTKCATGEAKVVGGKLVMRWNRYCLSPTNSERNYIKERNIRARATLPNCAPIKTDSQN